MARSEAKTVEEYLAGLPEDRREALAEVRRIILANLPEGYEEGMQYGMIGYAVPLDRFPGTYNGQPLGYAALASQKNYMSLYLNNVYGDAEMDRDFRGRFAEAGKKLDMGKSCVRFKRVDDLALDAVAEAIRATPVDEFISRYEAARAR